MIAPAVKLYAGVPIKLKIVTDHPRLANKPHAWTARAERLGEEILLVHDALPFLEELAALASGEHAKLLGECQVVNAGAAEYANPASRNSRRIALSTPGIPDDLAFFQLLCQTVEGTFVQAYLELVNAGVFPPGDASGCGYDLLRYGEGEYFKMHVDAVRNHPVLAHRRLAVVAFCNGGPELEGGELHFPRQGVTITPEPGLLVLFPAGFTHPHESKVVTRGVKYSVVTWFF